jgi:hypothetical protein
VFLVEEILEIITILRKKLRHTTEEVERNFLRITLLALRRCGLAMIGTAAGASLGTFISPGRGTFIGAFVGESIAYAL